MTLQSAYLAFMDTIKDELFSAAPEDLPLVRTAFEAGWKAQSTDILMRGAADYAAGRADPVSESIYFHYPRKEAKRAGVRAIRMAIRRAGNSKEAIEKIREATIKFGACVKQWPEDEKCFCPLPASWYNADRFNDDPAYWVRKPKPGQPQQIRVL